MFLCDILNVHILFLMSWSILYYTYCWNQLTQVTFLWFTVFDIITQRKNKYIVLHFLGSQKVERTDTISSDNIATFFFIWFWFEEEKILQPVATYDANNKWSKSHSLFIILKEKHLKLQLLKFIRNSHSIFSLKTCKKLQSWLEFLLQEIRNWFCRSLWQIQIYKDLIWALNAGKKNYLHDTNQWIDLKTQFISIWKDSSWGT